jgi:hypothetical protein
MLLQQRQGYVMLFAFNVVGSIKTLKVWVFIGLHYNAQNAEVKFALNLLLITRPKGPSWLQINNMAKHCTFCYRWIESELHATDCPEYNNDPRKGELMAEPQLQRKDDKKLFRFRTKLTYDAQITVLAADFEEARARFNKGSWQNEKRLALLDWNTI